ncbi:MAG: HpaII family restriction endonuclease [Bacteroidetes bacterium]|nr:MAG: HpaII family restriction endonuclease [Bacteroidota bacterium]
MLKGNKGEWSEIYTLLKLLGDGNLHSGNADLKKIKTLVYPIIKIIRTELDKDFEYILNKNFVIVTGDNNEVTISLKRFQEYTKLLLNKIKSSEKGTFFIPEIEIFLDDIKCKSLKAKSSVKTDIKIIIHDLKTNTQPLLGFSIKSQLGRPSTLLNASKSTNFIYELSANLNNEQINEINNTKKFVEKFNKLSQNNINLSFVNTEKLIFKNNLVLIDSLLPEIVAHLLILSSKSNKTTIFDLTKQLNQLNPLKYDLQYNHNFYEYKIKHLLTDIALGLMPAKVWRGTYDTTGGYLVVKKSGEILAYHIYNKNEFEDYLFENTRLIRASTTRHEFGKIYTQKGKQLIKLNLQIRFKN